MGGERMEGGTVGVWMEDRDRSMGNAFCFFGAGATGSLGDVLPWLDDEAAAWEDDAVDNCRGDCEIDVALPLLLPAVAGRMGKLNT
jgi:hypothetical protein